MFLPQSYFASVILMFITMLCWGSWANTQKLTKKWRFELFYWDYVFGVVLMSLIYLLFLGSGLESFNFTVRPSAYLQAGLGGMIFNAANLLLVAAIAYTGMAVAFPVAIGIALSVGTILSYWVHPQGQILLLGIGISAILLAIILDAKAYKKISKQAHQAQSSQKGLMIALCSGILMGLFYPLVARSMSGEGALNIYMANTIFALGVFIGNIPMNMFVMKKPFSGAPLRAQDYCSGMARNHFLGILGGMIWATGMTFNLLASHVAGPAIAYAFGQGATLVAAIWGVFIWREFKDAVNTKLILGGMFLSYILGLYCIGIA